MITAAEAGLTTEEYTAMQAATENTAQRITAYQWNPTFVSQHTSAHGEDTKDFDAVQHDNTLYRVAGDVCEKLQAGAWVAVSGYTAPSNPKNVPLSLISDTNLYVFAVTDTGVQRNVYSGTWSGWTTIITNANISFIAAVASDRLHYVIEDTTNNLWNLAMAVSGTPWDVTTSDIYWQYKIDSFDAVSIDANTDVLVMTSQVPGLLSAEYKDNKVTKHLIPSGGIIGFTFKYDTWSDHINIDILDEYTLWRYRRHVRLTYFNDTLYLTAYCSDGTDYAQITGYRLYKSKTGRHWTRGEITNYPAPSPYGLILLPLSNYLYGIFRSSIYRAKLTLQFGTPHTDMQLDVTNYAIPETLRYTRNPDMAAMSVVLDNSEHWMESSILDGSNVIHLKLEVGYYLYDEETETFAATPTLIQLGLFEVDEFKPSTGLTDYSVSLSARDYTSWMSSRSEAEQFKMWDPQAIGGDEFQNFDGTIYGGMGYTGPLSGTFATADNKLKVISNKAEAIGENTYVTPVWNGQFSTGFTLAQLSNGESAGIFFWMQDKENGWLFYYSQGDDKLRLLQWAGRTVEGITYHWTSSTMGWSSTLDTHYLRVKIKYARIRCYISDDNVTWTEVLSYLAPGQIPLTYGSDGRVIDTQGFMPTGSMGYWGYAYSDEDTPDTLPVALPPPTTITGVPTSITPRRIFSVSSGHVARGRINSIDTPTIDYEDITSNITGTIKWGYSNILSLQYHYVMSTAGLWRSSDIWADDLSWEFLHNPATITGGFTVYGTRIITHPAKPGWLLIPTRQFQCAISDDFGDTFSREYTDVYLSPLDAGSGSATWTVAMDVGKWNTSSSGVVWAVNALPPNLEGPDSDLLLYFSIHRSNNWGSTWNYVGGLEAVSDPSRTDISRTPILYVPYLRDNGLPNRNGSGQIIYIIHNNKFLVYNNLGTLVRSTTLPAGGYAGAPAINPLYVDPHDGKRMILLYRMTSPDRIRILYSINAGRTWTTIKEVSGTTYQNLNDYPFNPEFFFTTPAGDYTLDRGVNFLTAKPGFFGSEDVLFSDISLKELLDL